MKAPLLVWDVMMTTSTHATFSPWGYRNITTGMLEITPETRRIITRTQTMMMLPESSLQIVHPPRPWPMMLMLLGMFHLCWGTLLSVEWWLTIPFSTSYTLWLWPVIIGGWILLAVMFFGISQRERWIEVRLCQSDERITTWYVTLYRPMLLLQKEDERVYFLQHYLRTLGETSQD